MAGDFNHWSEIAQKFDDAVSQVVRKTAFDLQGNMQKQIRANGQIDTGFMVNSAYVRTFDESTYGQGKATVRYSAKTGLATKATRKNVYKATRQELLDEVAPPEDKYTAYIGVGASYGWVQNYGTHHIPARPFLEPAIETTRPSFETAMERIEEKLKSI